LTKHYTPVSRLLKYIETARVVNSAMTGIGVMFAVVLYSNGVLDPLRTSIGFFTGFLGTAAAMMINDYVDRHVDAVNKPWKPIPSGAVDPLKVLYASVALILTAVGINALASTQALIAAAVYGTLAYMYSFMRRFWWSHFIVAFSTTAPTLYGYVLAGMPREHVLLASLFSATIFLATLGRELVKAAMDVEGDVKCGYVTIPIKYGLNPTRRAVLTLALTAPALGIATGVIARASLYYFTLMLIASILYAHSMLKAYMHIGDKEVLERARKTTLLSMMLGLLAFFLSRL